MTKANDKTVKNETIEVYLVGGFLGSGKTTFLRQLMMQLGNQKLGLLVNEFGSIGIDAPLLMDDEVKLVEINDGSIFCACVGHGFSKTLKAFSEQPIDVLLIESSGMADPSSMNKILHDMTPYLARPFDYRGLVTLVDASNLLDYLDVLLPLQNQIAAADLILLNKIDLVNENTLAEIHETIREYQDEATIVNTEYGSISLEDLRSLMKNRGRISPSYNTPENRPESWVVIISEKQTLEGMEAFSKALAHDSWRIKGFVQQTDNTWLHVDSSAKHIVVKPLTSEVPASFDQGRLVIIGAKQAVGKFKEKIKVAWQKTAQGDIELSY
ncbi:MAG: GTP-binding protein [Eubacteriales bacterium]|nr:GTP-binding protein [Eubacteriales bacterium]